MSAVRIKIGRRGVKRAKKILKEYKALKADNPLGYDVVKSKYNRAHIRHPLQYAFSKKGWHNDSGVIDSPVSFLFTQGDEHGWEILMNAIDGGSNRVFIYVDVKEDGQIVFAVIDNGKGLTDFFNHPERKGLREESSSGFVNYNEIKRVQSEKAAAKSQGAVLGGGRGQALATISHFLNLTPEGFLLLGDVNNLVHSSAHQKLIGISLKDVSELPETGAVLIMSSCRFTEGFAREFINQNREREVGSPELNYISYLAEKHGDLMEHYSPWSALSCQSSIEEPLSGGQSPSDGKPSNLRLDSLEELTLFKHLSLETLVDDFKPSDNDDFDFQVEEKSEVKADAGMPEVKSEKAEVVKSEVKQEVKAEVSKRTSPKKPNLFINIPSSNGSSNNSIFSSSSLSFASHDSAEGLLSRSPSMTNKVG